MAPPGWEEPVILLAEELGAGKVVAAVPGAPRRAESVRNGVAEVAPEALIVLVHDAARPLVSDTVVERVLQPLAQGWDGAVPVLPVADTVKRVRNGHVIETVDRSDLVAVQTPQAFLAAQLRKALAGDLAAATDCSSLIEARGGRVRAVPGDRRLVKVTERADLELVESLLSPS